MLEQAFKSICQTDPTLLGFLPGGLYTFTEVGQRGIVATNPVCAEAFDMQYGIPVIRPCAVIRERISLPTFTRHDTQTQQTAYDGTVEVWLYQYEFYDHIDSAANRLYLLFNSRVYQDIGFTRPVQTLPRLIAPEFDNVSLRREDFLVKRVKRINNA